MFLVLISCGTRESKEKELVYNDPRADVAIPVNGSPYQCFCPPHLCGQCPPNAKVTVINNNENNCGEKPSCEKKCEADSQPVIIVKQHQTQDQSSVNQNEDKHITAIIKKKRYHCKRRYRGCGSHGMSCGESNVIPFAPEVEPMPDKTITDQDGNEFQCYIVERI